MKRLFNFLLFTFLGLSISFAQGKKVKYGKIDRADLEMTTYASDSSAAAVILYDKGITDLGYDKSTEILQ